MPSIYDRELILLTCSKCSVQVARPLFDLRRTMQIPCSACGTAIPIGNLTELVAEAVSKRLQREGETPDTSDTE
jgi:translation initiation factor 2 beta subunit (eIF-2beta)/eIF-5